MTIQILQDLDVRTSCVTAAVQDIGVLIRESTNPLDKANQLISIMLGDEITYKDPIQARHIAQHCAEMIVLQKTNNIKDILEQAEQRSQKIQSSSPWMFSSEETAEGSQPKRGNKLIEAEKLYKEYVHHAKNPLSSKEFVQLLIEKLDMTLSGANTYRYNLVKKYTV